MYHDHGNICDKDANQSGDGHYFVESCQVFRAPDCIYYLIIKINNRYEKG